jgi:NAD dependent epimerase/dehydratase
MSFFKNKKIFITGAGGFIGSHLTEKLLAMGGDVTCFIRYTSSNSIGNLRFIQKELLKITKIEHGDIRDQQRLKTLLSSQDIVFHLASSISIPYSYLGIRDVVSTNIDGTLSMLLAAKEVKVEKFIHTSTSEVYGSGQYFPMDEKHPLCAQSPYAASKIAADQLAESFFCSYNLPIVIVRPFNTYGPRQSARAIIPTIVAQALTREIIDLGALKTSRDLTYVSDTVDGFLKAAENKVDIGQILNLGTGVDISVKDLCKKICKVLGVEKKIHQDNKRMRPELSEVSRLQADFSKAASIIGYSPKVNLDDGILPTVTFIKENISCYRADIYNY